MPKPVTPYQEQDSKTWSFRIQRNGRRTYHSGFMSKTAAWEALAAMATDSARSDKPAGMGPHQTSIAVALSDYAQQCLPFRKGEPRCTASSYIHNLSFINLIKTVIALRAVYRAYCRHINREFRYGHMKISPFLPDFKS